MTAAPGADREQLATKPILAGLESRVDAKLAALVASVKLIPGLADCRRHGPESR